MLKSTLLNILSHLNDLENSKQPIMKGCVGKKLDRSLAQYESHLEETCKYILAKNPITIIKSLAVEPKPKTQGDDYDEI